METVYYMNLRKTGYLLLMAACAALLSLVCTECRRLVLPRPDEYIGSYILCPWIYVGFLYFCACKYKS